MVEDDLRDVRPVVLGHTNKLCIVRGMVVLTRLSDFEEMRKPGAELIHLSLVREGNRLFIRPAFIIHEEWEEKR